MNYSLTQTGNLVALAGLLGTVLNYFGVNIASEELEKLLTAAAVLVGIIVAWIGRYRQGDLTPAGFRK